MEWRAVGVVNVDAITDKPPKILTGRRHRGAAADAKDASLLPRQSGNAGRKAPLAFERGVGAQAIFDPPDNSPPPDQARFGCHSHARALHRARSQLKRFRA